MLVVEVFVCGACCCQFCGSEAAPVGGACGCGWLERVGLRKLKIRGAGC